MGTSDVMAWSGNPKDSGDMAAFLRRANTWQSLVIWWLEPDFNGSCDLLITRESATAEPLRVRPGDMVRLCDGEFSIDGNRRDGKPRARRANKGDGS